MTALEMASKEAMDWHELYMLERQRHEVVGNELLAALARLLNGPGEQRNAILKDMLWKLARRDWHGVADCAMDLRELRL